MPMYKISLYEPIGSDGTVQMLPPHVIEADSQDQAEKIAWYVWGSYSPFIDEIQREKIYP
jgi:hypothetical protein